MNRTKTLKKWYKTQHRPFSVKYGQTEQASDMYGNCMLFFLLLFCYLMIDILLANGISTWYRLNISKSEQSNIKQKIVPYHFNLIVIWYWWSWCPRYWDYRWWGSVLQACYTTDRFNALLYRLDQLRQF